MAKHTPAPWIAKGSTVYEDKGDKIYRLANCSETGDYALDDANAALMAAAPELLAALKNLEFKDGCFCTREKIPTDLHAAYCIKARAALQKAEGL
jgi:hypothetical protein